MAGVHIYTREELFLFCQNQPNGGKYKNIVVFMGWLSDVFQDVKFCMKDSACMDIQYCDKTELKVYGTCEFPIWFWLIIAAILLAVLVGIIVLLSCCLKKRSSRNTQEESELGQMQQNENRIIGTRSKTREQRGGQRGDYKLAPQN